MPCAECSTHKQEAVSLPQPSVLSCLLMPPVPSPEEWILLGCFIGHLLLALWVFLVSSFLHMEHSQCFLSSDLYFPLSCIWNPLFYPSWLGPHLLNSSILLLSTPTPSPDPASMLQDLPSHSQLGLSSFSPQQKMISWPPRLLCFTWHFRSAASPGKHIQGYLEIPCPVSTGQDITLPSV